MIDWDSRISKVKTKEDLADFVDGLRKSMEEEPDEWENPTLESFLDALSESIRSLDQVYTNLGREPIKSPNWRTMAEILLAASALE